MFLVVADAVLAVWLVFAFSSFDSKGVTLAKCDKVNIDIADGATNGFIDAKEIRRRLVAAGIYPIDKSVAEINTRSIEEMLKRSPFVKTAECYKTEDGHVYISVTQRMPVVRIKSESGDDYYVDDNDCIMPRSNYTSDLIIATGSIDRWYATNYIAPLSKAILSNELWQNLVEQINVLPDHGVELVPRVGEHIVFIGRLPDGKGRYSHQRAIFDYVDKKLTRLEKFYKYGLSQVGWNKYSYINIEFDNQIICKKATHTASAAPAPEPAPQAETAPAARQEQQGGQQETQNNSANKPKPAVKEAQTTANNKPQQTAKKPQQTANSKPQSTAKKPQQAANKSQTTAKKPQDKPKETKKTI